VRHRALHRAIKLARLRGTTRAQARLQNLGAPGKLSPGTKKFHEATKFQNIKQIDNWRLCLAAISRSVMQSLVTRSVVTLS
jgi:hypothetical protein